MRGINQAKINFWIENHKAAEVYPSGIRSYCKEQNISLTMYYKWKKRIAVIKAKELRPVFLPVQIKESKKPINTEPIASSKDIANILPEAKWLAEVLAHFVRGLR